MSRRAPVLLFSLLATSVLLAKGAPALAASIKDRVLYSRDIKPILSNNCYACHGPDEAKRKAKLRLDTADGAVEELRGGRHAIVAGDITKSSLIERITSTEEDEVMPPPKTGKHLTDEQKALMKRWIEQGAKFDKHWSYVTPTRSTPPKIKDRTWAINPIDEFVESRLEDEGITHAEEADRRTLLRRLSFDLIGLPPTPEEVRAFEADTSPKRTRSSQ